MKTNGATQIAATETSVIQSAINSGSRGFHRDGTALIRRRQIAHLTPPTLSTSAVRHDDGHVMTSSTTEIAQPRPKSKISIDCMKAQSASICVDCEGPPPVMP